MQINSEDIELPEGKSKEEAKDSLLLGLRYAVSAELKESFVSLTDVLFNLEKRSYPRILEYTEGQSEVIPLAMSFALDNGLEGPFAQWAELYALHTGLVPTEEFQASEVGLDRFRSCFFSYAHKDAVFVNRLRDDLMQAGVDCWQDKHDLKGGAFWRQQIRDEIQVRDKVIIVCSEESLARTNVVEEIVIGMEGERRSKGLKLFPIRIDDFIFSAEAEKLCESLPSNLRREDWLSYLRNYHVPDFSGWENDAQYKVAFAGLVRDLSEPTSPETVIQAKAENLFQAPTTVQIEALVEAIRQRKLHIAEYVEGSSPHGTYYPEQFLKQDQERLKFLLAVRSSDYGYDALYSEAIKYTE